MVGGRASRIFAPAFSEDYRRHPLVLVDVGASGGLEPHWRPAVPHLRIVGFEPDKREFSNLANNASPNVAYLNTGLYKESASLTFYLTRKQQVSSMFRPNRAFLDAFPESDRFDIVGTTTIAVDTLDSQSGAIDDADFIKIDTQGSELFVLQGAAGTIRDRVVFGLEVEVEFAELYQGQPLFSDVDMFVRQQGFELFDLWTTCWKRTIGIDYGKARGQLVSGNALYLRKTAGFTESLTRVNDEVRRKAKVLRAISICLLYGYFDYALEVLSATRECFRNSEYEDLRRWLTQRVGSYRRIPGFKGKNRIAGVLFRLWEVLKPDYDGWASVDSHLGNL